MKAISRLLALLLFALPAWGVCRSAGTANSELRSNVVTTWHDAAGFDWAGGWSQNANDSTNADYFMYVAGGVPAANTLTANGAFIIVNSSGKRGFHEYGNGTNELAAVGTFCTSNSCSATPPQWMALVAEKVSSVKTYNLDELNHVRFGGTGDNPALTGNKAWVESYSATYTNEHAGGTAGIAIVVSGPALANFANYWVYRGNLHETLQRAAAIGFYPWDSDRFFLVPCTSWDKPGMYGAVPFTYTVNNGPFGAPQSPPPATVLVLWNLQ